MIKQPGVEDASRPLLLTPERAAREMSIARSTLYRLLADGELQYVKIGRSTRIPLAEVERWVAQRLGTN